MKMLLHFYLRAEFINGFYNPTFINLFYNNEKKINTQGNEKCENIQRAKFSGID